MGMPFSPARFDKLLKGLGQRVEWKRATPCPCRNFDEGSGAARPGCKACKGKGTLWATPVPAWTGLQAAKPSRAERDSGGWMAGDVVLTVPGASPLWRAGEHDLVVMGDTSEPFALVLEHDGEPRIFPPFPVVSIDRCIFLRAGDVVVEADPPAVADDGTITWEAGAVAPEPGRQFTIQGRRRPTYFVWQELPQDRAHCGGLALPRKIHARRFDLFGR